MSDTLISDRYHCGDRGLVSELKRNLSGRAAKCRSVRIRGMNAGDDDDLPELHAARQYGICVIRRAIARVRWPS